MRPKLFSLFFVLSVTISLSTQHDAKGGSFSGSFSSSSSSSQSSSSSSSSSGSFSGTGSLNQLGGLKDFIGNFANAGAHAGGAAVSGTGGVANAGSQASSGAIAGSGVKIGSAPDSGSNVPKGSLIPHNNGHNVNQGLGVGGGVGFGSNYEAAAKHGFGQTVPNDNEYKPFTSSPTKVPDENTIKEIQVKPDDHIPSISSQSSDNAQSTAVSGGNHNTAAIQPLPLTPVIGGTTKYDAVGNGHYPDSPTDIPDNPINGNNYNFGATGHSYGIHRPAYNPEGSNYAGVKKPCCKGPFPGPSGSIYDSKPASSIGPGPNPIFPFHPSGAGVPPNHGTGSKIPGSSVAPESKPTFPFNPSGVGVGASPGTGFTTTGSKVPCCKGPFPGPSGSIYDSKPATSVSAVPSHGQVSTGSHTTSGIYETNKRPFPGPEGSIHEGKPASSVSTSSGNPFGAPGQTIHYGVHSGHSGYFPQFGHVSKPVSSIPPVSTGGQYPVPTGPQTNSVASIDNNGHSTKPDNKPVTSVSTVSSSVGNQYSSYPQSSSHTTSDNAPSVVNSAVDSGTAVHTGPQEHPHAPNYDVPKPSIVLHPPFLGQPIYDKPIYNHPSSPDFIVVGKIPSQNDKRVYTSDEVYITKVDSGADKPLTKPHDTAPSKPANEGGTGGLDTTVSTGAIFDEKIDSNIKSTTGGDSGIARFNVPFGSFGQSVSTAISTSSSSTANVEKDENKPTSTFDNKPSEDGYAGVDINVHKPHVSSHNKPSVHSEAYYPETQNTFGTGTHSVVDNVVNKPGFATRPPSKEIQTNFDSVTGNVVVQTPDGSVGGKVVPTVSVSSQPTFDSGIGGSVSTSGVSSGTHFHESSGKFKPHAVGGSNFESQYNTGNVIVHKPDGSNSNGRDAIPSIPSEEYKPGFIGGSGVTTGNVLIEKPDGLISHGKDSPSTFDSSQGPHGSSGYATGGVFIHKPDGSVTHGKDSPGAYDSSSLQSPHGSSGYATGGVFVHKPDGSVTHGKDSPSAYDSSQGPHGSSGYATGGVFIHKPDGSVTHGKDSPAFDSSQGPHGSSGYATGSVFIRKPGGIFTAGSDLPHGGRYGSPSHFYGYSSGFGGGSGANGVKGSSGSSAYGFAGAHSSAGAYSGAKSYARAGAGFPGIFKELLGKHNFGGISGAGSFASSSSYAGASAGSYAGHY